MKVIRCQNSHFYDADKYNECPVCGAPPLTDGGEKKPATSQSHFWGGKKEPTISPSTEPIVEPIQQSAEPSVAENPMKTVGMFGESDVKENDCGEIEIQVNKETEEPFATEPVPQSAVRVSAEPVRAENPIQAQQTARVDSLEEQIRTASQDNGDKTVGYFSAPSTQSSVSEAQAPMQQKPSGEPVVGWLVCVKGKHFGEAFAISAGRNSIGRAPSNKLVLSKDNTVSREKHAWVTYEPKKRDFFVQPGESSGLVYLNDENVMETKKLNDRDFIEIGDGKYMLVALCCSSFSWEDYLG